MTSRIRLIYTHTFFSQYGIPVNDSGYSDTNHFIKDFKKYTGQTPMQYLRTCNMKSCLTESRSRISLEKFS
ncbi:AraC family transcriptional regulator [Bacteroides sp.]|uniref:AraC family transcriptional regulator n=1 Tax=Bacteroides sp. TaxID=29523 RepID=UPI003A92E342